MIPLLASGAASLANVLVNRISGSSSGSSGNVTLDPKEFERALNKAVGGRGMLSPAEQQAVALNQKLMQAPEVVATLGTQPVGSVGGVEVRQDGSLILQTTQGPVNVPLTLESRQLAREAYAASLAVGAIAPVSPSSALGGVQSVLRIPLAVPSVSPASSSLLG